MEKYYTPTIDEFYVGYECEMKNSSDSKYFDWELCIFKHNFSNQLNEDYCFEYLYSDLQEGNIRTKYLDEQDILDLGFKQVDDFKFTLTKGYYDEEDDDTGFVYQLIISPTNTLILIEEFPINFGKAVRSCYEGNCDTVFNGICKSKNELKTILKFLNV